MVESKIALNILKQGENYVGFIQSVETAAALQQKHRIVCTPIGLLAHKPQQQTDGPPFTINMNQILMCQELAIVERNYIDIQQLSANQSKDFMIFRHLYNLGYYITGGEKFGGTYLLYEGEPCKVHAKSLIFTDQNLTPIEMNRAANIVNKDAIYVGVSNNNKVFQLKIQRQEGYQGKKKNK